MPVCCNRDMLRFALTQSLSPRRGRRYGVDCKGGTVTAHQDDWIFLVKGRRWRVELPSRRTTQPPTYTWSREMRIRHFFLGFLTARNPVGCPTKSFSIVHPARGVA